MNNDCILCKLNAEEIEVTKLYEDDIVTVIMDIQPVNTGHVLVFPKECVQLVGDLDDNTVAHMFTIAKKMNIALRNSGLNCEGVNYFLADGEAAMQEIPHVHLHVFPRFEGDGFGLKHSDKYFKLPTRNEINAAASKIKDALKLQ
ncbi:HIT family protein [bacterium]|nr:HIT family protein [bacterium]